MSNRSALRSFRGVGMSSKSWTVGIVVVVVLVVSAVVLGGAYYQTKHDTIVVTDKERVCSSDNNGNSNCKYLIFTDGTTYKMTDSIAIGRFNSSDAYGKVKRCHRYDISYYGWRFGFTSTNPNIKDMTDRGRVEGCEPD